MAVPRKVMPWTAPYLLACVISYGAAGSNSTLMLREKPSGNAAPAPMHFNRYPLFISTGSTDSLHSYSKKLIDLTKGAKAGTDLDFLSPLTFNFTDKGNHSLPHAVATTVISLQDLNAKLEAAAAESAIKVPANKQNPVVLVFGGQEHYHIGLSEDVYQCQRCSVSTSIQSTLF